MTGDDCALLVVDMQNGFCHPGGSFAAMGCNVEALRAAIGGCQELIGAAHAASVPVIFTRFVYQPGHVDASAVSRELFPQIKEHNGLVAGSWDADLLDDMPVAESDLVIDKSRYSAFYGTRLEPLLHGLGVRSLIVCGVTTNMCVETSVRDACQRDYRPYVVADATAEFTPERHQHALTAIRYGFGWIVDREQVIGELAQRAAGRTAAAR